MTIQRALIIAGGVQRQVASSDEIETASSFVDKGTVSSGTVTLDRSAGTYQRLQVGGALTVAISNWPASGVAGDLVLEIVNGGSAAITWPSAWTWKQSDGSYGASPPRTLQASGTDLVALVTRNGGTAVRAIM